MGIKILSSKNQISLPEQQRAARHRSQKMAAAAAISIANYGVISRNKIVQTIPTFGAPAMAALSFIHFTLMNRKINIMFC